VSTDHRPLIALIHGVPAAIEPATLAIREQIPDAKIWNILDDRLIEEVGRQGSVTPALLARMLRLIDHALLEGADGVLITCSLYSFVASAVQTDRPVPVLGADSAAFHDVIEAQPRRVLLVASVQAALEESTDRLREVAREHHAHFDVVPILVGGALDAVRAGDIPTLADLVAAAVRLEMRDGDAVLFAQYSLSPAAARVAVALGTPVFAGPARAARELLAAIEHPDRRHHQYYAD
jgi:hypothetical protein